MNTRILSYIVLTLVLILNACSPLTIVRSSGEQPAPVEDVDSSSTGYQPVTVDHVEVEVGVGSPIPVHVIVSGSLPDICSQIEHTAILQDGSNFNITLSATPAQEGCLQDTLPFKMSIPLNMVELPAGSYSVEVNGTHADFMMETANTTSSLPTTDSAITKDDIQVDSVNVEIGVGSPVPVHAVVGLSLPSTCAQLGEIRLHRDGKTFFVRLIADIAERPDCKADLIPFRLEIPLNTVNLPEGPSEVNVNGVIASFDPRTAPAATSDAQVEREPIQIEHVGVQVGEGSPIPVEIIASGTWPDLCSQISEVQSQINGFEIDVIILASTAESCPPDHLELPFRFALPLNIVEMPEGTYTITVNGVSNSLDLPPGP